MTRKTEILNRLTFQFNRAERAYMFYLKEKIYLYALIIRKANLSICSLLEANVDLFDDELKNHAQELLLHYDIWLVQFEALENELKPKINSSFIFDRYQGTPAFPKESKVAFVQAHKDLEI